MLDFWFTMGAAVADPTLLTAITNPTPVFQQMPASLTIGGTTTPLPSSGLLDQNSTTLLRQKLRDTLVGKYGAAVVPPISLYTAGKVCQLWSVNRTDLIGSLSKANTAFKAASQAQPVSLSQPLLTLIGACMVDPNLSLAFRQQQQLPIASEFGVVPSAGNAAWGVVQSWLNHANFQPAQDQLLTSWTHPCREVVVWYADFQTAAI